MHKNLRVNKAAFTGWIEERNPNGKERLAIKALVSTRTIDRLLDGTVPGHPRTRTSIATAMGVRERTLFPPKVTS